MSDRIGRQFAKSIEDLHHEQRYQDLLIDAKGMLPKYLGEDTVIKKALYNAIEKYDVDKMKAIIQVYPEIFEDLELKRRLINMPQREALSLNSRYR